MKRIVGVNYENGEVSGLTVTGLKDGTDSAYFKRVHTAYWVEYDPFFNLYKMRSRNKQE